MTDPAPNAAGTIADTAALWIVRREQDDWSAEEERALQAWLDESMAHKAAFWRLEHGWREADRVTALGGGNLGVPARRASRRWMPRLSARARWLGAAAAAMLAVTVGVNRETVTPRLAPAAAPAAPIALASYRTAVGGHRTVTLADGSDVQLNTATRLRAAAAPDAREVWLDDGEAYFDIVHRPDRRFVVHAGPRTITVLGTRFTVRRDRDRVTVAVLSGRVQVDDAQAPAGSPRTAIVSAGNVALIEPRSTLISTSGTATIKAMTAWREQMIVFDDTPLAEVAAEFNRYSPRPIRIDDADLARVRIGGAFRTDDRDGFVDLLRTAYGVHVRRDDGAVVLTH